MDKKLKKVIPNYGITIIAIEVILIILSIFAYLNPKSLDFFIGTGVT